MKVEVNKSVDTRKLVAVVGSDGESLFVRADDDCMCIYMSSYGGRGLRASRHIYSLEDTLTAGGPLRTAVYEGNSVTLQF